MRRFALASALALLGCAERRDLDPRATAVVGLASLPELRLRTPLRESTVVPMTQVVVTRGEIAVENGLGLQRLSAASRAKLRESLGAEAARDLVPLVARRVVELDDGAVRVVDRDERGVPKLRSVIEALEPLRRALEGQPLGGQAELEGVRTIGIRADAAVRAATIRAIAASIVGYRVVLLVRRAAAVVGVDWSLRIADAPRLRVFVRRSSEGLLACRSRVAAGERPCAPIDEILSALLVNPLECGRGVGVVQIGFDDRVTLGEVLAHLPADREAPSGGAPSGPEGGWDLDAGSEREALCSEAPRAP